MARTTFTIRIDPELKARLERIEMFEDRSASNITNQAIRALVEEREATQELVQTGLALVERGDTIEETAVDAWLAPPVGTDFPKAVKRS